jgi:hypothetical protein
MVAARIVIANLLLLLKPARQSELFAGLHAVGHSPSTLASTGAKVRDLEPAASPGWPRLNSLRGCVRVLRKRQAHCAGRRSEESCCWEVDRASAIGQRCIEACKCMRIVVQPVAFCKGGMAKAGGGRMMKEEEFPAHQRSSPQLLEKAPSGQSGLPGC